MKPISFDTDQSPDDYFVPVTFPGTMWTRVIEAAQGPNPEIAEAAFCELSRQYYEPISEWFLRKVPNASLAADYTHDFLETRFLERDAKRRSFLHMVSRHPSFYPGEIKHPQLLFARLTNSEAIDPFADYLRGRLHELPQGIPESEPKKHLLDAEIRWKLNAILSAPCLYSEKAFAGITIRDADKLEHAGKLSSLETEWLNRRLLEDACPNELPKRNPVKFRQVLLGRLNWYLKSRQREALNDADVGADQGFFEAQIAEESVPEFDRSFVLIWLEQAIRSSSSEPSMLEYFRLTLKGEAPPQAEFASRLDITVNNFKVRYLRFKRQIVKAFIEIAHLYGSEDELEYLKALLPSRAIDLSVD